MKRILLTLALCLSAATAQAHNWYWAPYGVGYFQWTNGVSNDGFLYARTYSGCCGYSYKQVKAIAIPVKYGVGWQEATVNATYALQDRQAFLESQRLLLGASGVSSSSSYLSQETYQSGIQPFTTSVADTDYLAHAIDRATLRSGDIMSSGIAAMSDAETKRLAMSANVQIATSPTTVTKTFSQASVSNPVAALQSSDPISAMRSMLIATNCASCHSGASAKSGLDLANIAAYSVEDRAAIADEALKKMQAGEMPPKKQLPQAVVDEIANGIRGEQPKVYKYVPKKAESKPEPMP